MRRISVALVVLALLLVIAASAIMLPKVSITSGVEQYSGEERTFAAYALKQTDLLVGGSIEPLMIVARHVDEIQRTGDQGSCGYEPFLVNHQYQATVKLYTFFGQEYGFVSVDCSDAHIRRN
ncbi:hypothetical protein SE17_03410 [Kouleothrix aurantiaca]|uniref:Uncharacterized protein n=1 Tax=Kouleothrix aurantiaca TaxID=186479 RepID=A0A0N8PT44_9CHLR|nr:hypothetical protein SE17_03410 [Kouleothrix aurantiaca]